MKLEKPKATYETNRVVFSVITQRIFFCPCLKVLDNGVREVVGNKYDVTADLQPYLLKKYRTEAMIIRRKGR